MTEPPPAPPTRAARLPKFSRVLVCTTVLLVVTVLAAMVLAVWPSGYLIDAPGNAIDTAELVKVPPTVKSYTHPGGFRLVTVAETGKPVFGQAFVAWLDSNADVFPRQEVVGDTPREAELRYEAVLMQGAKQSAIYKAMRVLGLQASMTGGGVFVDRIVPGSPAQGVLAIGDTITSIDGKPVSTVDDLTRFMKSAKVGQRVKFVVDRLGVSSNKVLHVKLGATTRDNKREPFLGIYMETRPNYQFPFKVGFDTGDIGGPSAGLALTLSLINTLSSNGLTQGNEIAVTGTMQADGTVGMIGGIRQKVAAVEAAGVHYFLVPLGNAADACQAVGDAYSTAAAKKLPVPCGSAEKGLRIIPVKSLDDALAKVRALPQKSPH